MSLQHVLIFNIHDVSVEQVDKVLTAHIEDVVTVALKVLVNLHAARPEELWDIIVTEESLGDFKASTIAKRS